MGRDMISGDVEFGHDLGFSHQHSISVLENGNILIFDNGKYSDEYWGANTLQSRALEIKITENNGQYSAEIVWEYILPQNLFGYHNLDTFPLRGEIVLAQNPIQPQY